MKKLTSILLTVLLSYSIPLTCLHAEGDTPSPQILKETASTLRDEVSTLAREYRKASDGKKWGRSPGHQAVYKKIFSYRNELQTTAEMCTSGQSPDRLLTIAMDCKRIGKVMTELAEFVILPDETLERIHVLSEQSNQLLPAIEKYEQRYFIWKKAALEQQYVDDLAGLQRELSALVASQKKIAVACVATTPPKQVIVIDASGKGTHP